MPDDDASEAGAGDGEEGEGGAEEGHDGEGDEPEPLDEEDLVVDDVEAEDAHGVVDVEVARQRAGGKLAPACPIGEMQFSNFFDTQYSTLSCYFWIWDKLSCPRHIKFKSAGIFLPMKAVAVPVLISFSS